MPSAQGKFVWYECITNDVDRAKVFYSELLGWRIEGVPMAAGFTYNMIMNGETAQGGVLSPPGHAGPPHWVSYLAVDDVDASAKAVVANGGQSMMDAMDMPEVGRMQLVQDPQGAPFFLFRGAEEAGESNFQGPGSWWWNELTTSDVDGALAFYENTFGMTHDTMPMEQGNYYLLKVPGAEQAHAGLMALPMPEAPTAWTPYVHVPDCDKTLERATSLGGSVVVPAQDIPDVGRFGFIADPTGAVLAVAKPAA